ncbi:hypothetical protein L484_023109 [Morus notabilis]|uniref:Uncharacterized protein n=1 Tax=Morus notabilis TaxID=981085 RepID=W9SAS0_9ROSA|nr:hypothetical protein L484_023109 [Morus notabilis]
MIDPLKGALWQVAKTFSHRHLWDIPTEESVENDDIVQEDNSSDGHFTFKHGNVDVDDFMEEEVDETLEEYVDDEVREDDQKRL